MNIIQALIGFILMVGIFSFLFLLAWYVAIPLLLVFVCVGLFNLIRFKWHMKNFRGFSHTEKFYETKNKKSHDQVIDVEYTEIK